VTSNNHEAAGDLPEDPVDQATAGPGVDAAPDSAGAATQSQAPPAQEAPADAAPAEPGSAQASVAEQLAERTADLQRLQAEYLNYKRRVDRDRELVRGTATAEVVTAILPVLDDIGRAREHDELHGGFKAVAESLARTLETFGLEPFGEKGDPFDPTVHEAMLHGYSDEVSEPVADEVLQVGYRIGERVLRPARVSVVEPTDDETESQEQPAQQ